MCAQCSCLHRLTGVAAVVYRLALRQLSPARPSSGSSLQLIASLPFGSRQPEEIRDSTSSALGSKAMSFCVTRTPKPTQQRRRTRDNAVALTAEEMPWPSPRRLRSTPKRPPAAAARRTSPSRSPSPGPSPRTGHGRNQCARLLPAGLLLVTAIGVLAVATKPPGPAESETVSYAEVRLADRASEIDTTRLMSTRADGRKGVMYLNGQKDTAPSGWAQGLLNKYTRQVLRNATRDLDASRRRREGSDLPPGSCSRVGDDYLQVRDARFEAFVRRGPSGAMAAKAMDKVADGWTAMLTHEMIVGCSTSTDDAIQSAADKANDTAEEAVTIWWALGNDEESNIGAARLPGSNSTEPARVINTVAPGDAIITLGRELSDASAGPVTPVGTNPSVFWWYGMTFVPSTSAERDQTHPIKHSEEPKPVRSEASAAADAAAAAADAAESVSALQPIVRPWPISAAPRSYTDPGYTNAGLVLVNQIDHKADLMSILPITEAVNRAVSELAEHRRVLTELASTRMDTVANRAKSMTNRVIDAAITATADAKASVGTVSEWLSTDPLRRYLTER